MHIGHERVPPVRPIKRIKVALESILIKQLWIPPIKVSQTVILERQFNQVLQKIDLFRGKRLLRQFLLGNRPKCPDRRRKCPKELDLIGQHSILDFRNLGIGLLLRLHQEFAL